MKYLVNLYSWENPRLCFGDVELKKDEKVIIEGEFGNDLGVVVEAGLEIKEEGQPIVRVATSRDIEAFQKNE